MGITCKQTDAAIEAFFERCFQIIADQVRVHLQFLGEQCVNKIRDRSAEESWMDQTGNLRSSIAYAVFENGEKKIQGAFVNFNNAVEGIPSAKSLIKKLASEYSDAYALVVVAGMSYAEFVEALDSKDVLASTRMWAEAKVDRMLDQALDIAAQKINKLKI